MEGGVDVAVVGLVDKASRHEGNTLVVQTSTEEELYKEKQKKQKFKNKTFDKKKLSLRQIASPKLIERVREKEQNWIFSASFFITTFSQSSKTKRTQNLRSATLNFKKKLVDFEIEYYLFRKP